MPTVIRAEGISKKYVIGHEGNASYHTLRDAISARAQAFSRHAMNPFAAHFRPDDSNSEEFWALREVSFEVQEGERLGIIGSNGAGKSTLLKILSRITEPTDGSMMICGRVASLLEVGTGFHPELTGRENIFLNGSILGMSKAEIKRKFDAIVDFAEVERFLDTPVKHFSSGMYVRLAFAVAAFLEPDILIVDEVLAVGDSKFQKKSLSKMGELRNDGRTVLFVSHNMVAIQNLCSKALLLQGGRVTKAGDVEDVVMSYLRAGDDERESASYSSGDLEQNYSLARFMSWKVEPCASQRHSTISGSDISICILVNCEVDLDDCKIGIAIWTDDGVLAWSAITSDIPGFSPTIGRGQNFVRFNIRGFALRSGRYRLEVSIDSKGARLNRWHAIPHLLVLPRVTTSLTQEWQGLATFDYSVDIERTDANAT